MTTIAQVKDVVQPLLARNPDLELIDRLVVVKPVRHILRGILIDRSSNPLDFNPHWSMEFLFKPDAHFTLSWGNRLYRKSHGPYLVTDPTTPMVMCEQIEQEALPLLRPVQTIDDFLAFIATDHVRGHSLRRVDKVFVDIALGDLDAAREICAGIASYETKSSSFLPLMQEEYDFITKVVYPPLLANDRRGLARLLAYCEERAVRRSKIAHLWEPTPFPLETQSDQA